MRAASSTRSRWITYALGAGGVVILILFATSTNLADLGRALRGARPGLLALAVAGIVSQILVKAARWRYMVHRQTGIAISARFATVSVVCGVAAGSVAPARSFELAKALLLRDSHGVGLGLSMSAMIVERLLDLVLFIGAVLLAALLLPRQMVVANSVLPAVIGIIIAGIVLLFAAPGRAGAWAGAAAQVVPMPRAVRARALNLIDALCGSIRIWRQRRTLGPLFALTSLSTAMDLARVYTVFWAFGAALSVPLLVFTYVGAGLLGMALLVPGGVGVTEVSQVGLITLLAPGVVPSAVARSAVLADRFLSYYAVTVIGGALLVAYHRYRHIFR